MALEHLRKLEIGKFKKKRFYLLMWHFEKVCNKINGMLNVLLSTKKLGGGLQKVLTLVKFSSEQSKA
jgi:hypothetical protein